MQVTLKVLLEEVARKGSWYGGGSAAALSAALSAALLEKLITQPRTVRRLIRIRTECIKLIDRDAVVFSRVIQMTRNSPRSKFKQALKKAIDIPYGVFVYAHIVEAICRKARRSVKPQLQSDLRCALSIAKSAYESARVLIDTNLKWLDEPSYSRRMRDRLRASSRR